MAAIGAMVKNKFVILCVDDEENPLVLRKFLLQKAGYEVITATDGTEAIALYAANKDRVKVILMDMNMPNLDGEATARVLLKLDSQVRIISSSGFVANKKKTKTLPVKAFLPKPYTAELLLSTIFNIINHEDHEGRILKF